VSSSLRKLGERLRLPERARSKGVEREGAQVRRESAARSTWRRFRRGTDRYRLLTDVVGGLLIVAFVIGGMAAVTGGVWPPVVVVESGSMMHAIQETPYGRFGTIDVGDLVFLRGVDGPEDVETWAEGGKLRYGRPGDVIAYWPNGDRDTTNLTSPTTLIIHRAIAYIEVRGDYPNNEYALYWTDGEVRVWGPNGIYFPPLGFDETSPFIFTPQSGYQPGYSGFITKGDNAFSNPQSDQALGISRLVEPTWIEATVYGEIPWMGLGKLALQSDKTNPEVPNWERIGNAFAPLELWTMFFLTLAIIVLVPLSVDTYRAWRRLKAEEETTRRIEEENRRRLEARRAAKKAARPVVSFAEVVSARPLASGRPGGNPPQGGRPPGHK
jgi:signal peptidase I